MGKMFEKCPNLVILQDNENLTKWEKSILTVWVFPGR
jgi:hypothetical protein